MTPRRSGYLCLKSCVYLHFFLSHVCCTQRSDRTLVAQYFPFGQTESYSFAFTYKLKAEVESTFMLPLFKDGFMNAFIYVTFSGPNMLYYPILRKVENDVGPIIMKHAVPRVRFFKIWFILGLYFSTSSHYDDCLLYCIALKIK